MTAEASRLERAGADIIAIPCNTAHYFYDAICNAVTVPILNIITETARYCQASGAKKIGVLATEGTAASGAYQKFLDGYSIEVIPLTPSEQSIISSIIFDQIKKGLAPDIGSFVSVIKALRMRGAELIVLGCTELSLIKKNYSLPEYIIDSLELLALSAIVACKKAPTGFDASILSCLSDDNFCKKSIAVASLLRYLLNFDAQVGHIQRCMGSSSTLGAISIWQASIFVNISWHI
jgi:aspartate racemase